LFKGQGLARMMAESNFKDLGVNFIKNWSGNQQAKLFDKVAQANPPLIECAWYKDILFFLQKLQPPDGIEKNKVRDLKLK